VKWNGKCSLCNEWWHSFMNQRLNHLVLLYKKCSCIIMSLNTYNKNIDIIWIYLFIKHVLFILMSFYKCKMHVSRVETIWESLSFHLITWLPVFNVPQFIAILVIPPNYRLHYRNIPLHCNFNYLNHPT
jgi:cytochrome c oxidase subunit IV